MFKIKNIDLLKNIGFSECKTSLHPKALVKILDDTFLLKVWVSEPCINMWDGKDKNKNSMLALVQYKNMRNGFYDSVVVHYGNDMLQEYVPMFKNNIYEV